MNKTTKYLLPIALMAIVFLYSCKKEKAPPTAPSVTTAALTNITTTGATGGGTITSDGGLPITASGIVLSKYHATPTLADTVVSGTTATGSFTNNITNLAFGTTYYIRAYATNSVGTGYGSVVTLNTTNDDTKVRFTYNGAEVTYGVITSAATGKKWMDRNLGASRVATAFNDDQAYGDYFQWGRLADGHQIKTSTTTTTLSTSDVPGNNMFILNSGSSDYWRNPFNANLWQGSSGVNNPCPSGWHIPTKTEWEAEKSITNRTTAFSLFKIPAAGFRSGFLLQGGGLLFSVGVESIFWMSTLDLGVKPNPHSYWIDAGSAYTSGYQSAHGCTVRCIKD